MADALWQRAVAIWRGRRIPLSWLLLTRQPMRLAVALAGIAFAGILMFMQLGFRDGLFEASVTVHKLFDADVVLVSPRTMSSIGMASFPRRRLVQTLADPDVIGISPINWNLLLWRNPEARTTRSILTLGIEPDDPIFLDETIRRQARLLQNRGWVLFDQRSRPEFGPIEAWIKQGRTVETEVSGQRIRVADLVSLGPSFGADGNMITSRETYFALMPTTP
ncbi:MAG: ABC transporter, partial [Cyanobacteria bacterium M_surface_9_m1_291]|nr:ABC transporter [Cyanobacteria bacterium M_surface_9_m1_291]